jgi:ElaA protein
MTLTWLHKSFDELLPAQLYAILQLRAEVFVLEQNCPFVDPDGKDTYCQHLMGFASDGRLMAYTRIVPAGVSYTEPSIGRVVTAPVARKFGLGIELMHQSVALCEQLHGKQPIKIGAQLYLKRFYESYGFVQTSDVYLEDGIEHIEMIRS